MSHLPAYQSNVSFPQRAVVTAGMPYGNKNLHFGHIAGVFVPADFFARFLRDRIGSDNVIFVSGTDCYGSPIMEGYRKLEESGEAQELGYTSLIDYVNTNHTAQQESLDAFLISTNLFGGSALAPAVEKHHALSADIINRLLESGDLQPQETLQFYDVEAQQFLNGRQVQGFCPVQGCKSEKAYADECDLGHQFEPSDLIKPISQLTQTTPELRPVKNYYFNLPRYREFLLEQVAQIFNDPAQRNVVAQTAEETLGKPAIYIKNELEEQYLSIADQMPAHQHIPADKGKQSFSIVFENHLDREAGRVCLAQAGMRYRTGKSLVPFRITGNISWGVPTPAHADMEGLTIWVWPESLWAPISFTQVVLEGDTASTSVHIPSFNPTTRNWRDWWCSDEAHVYQFIGQDNIFFYCVAQPALFEALNWNLKPTTAVANHHILFMGKKASSSGAIKPPSALELLDHYKPEQLRAHWLSLGLESKSVSFSPKPFDSKNKDNPRVADPALKEDALLSNVLNRLARSCFYGMAQHTSCRLAGGTPHEEVVHAAHRAAHQFEDLVSKLDFHSALGVADSYIREANKRWSSASKAASQLEDAAQQQAAFAQALIDACFELHVSAVLMHPVAPEGCEKIADAFGIDHERFFSWEHICSDLAELVQSDPHHVAELPPRYDFFSKHPSQYR